MLACYASITGWQVFQDLLIVKKACWPIRGWNSDFAAGVRWFGEARFRISTLQSDGTSVAAVGVCEKIKNKKKKKKEQLDVWTLPLAALPKTLLPPVLSVLSLHCLDAVLQQHSAVSLNKPHNTLHLDSGCVMHTGAYNNASKRWRHYYVCCKKKKKRGETLLFSVGVMWNCWTFTCFRTTPSAQRAPNRSWII